MVGCNGRVDMSIEFSNWYDDTSHMNDDSCLCRYTDDDDEEEDNMVWMNGKSFLAACTACPPCLLMMEIREENKWEDWSGFEL